MDNKGLAKSKRAHSQRHSKKHHPKQTLRTPPLVGPSAAKNALELSAKQDGGKLHQSQGFSALPSNWDRYDDEDDSDLENFAHDSLSQTTDVVPKSKGADYTYLISEAKSQLETQISSESFPSLDDDLTGFYKGLGPLLAVRGQGILSWMEGDNFDVGDRASANVEASFLSLNLHALAEKLAKVDLSERLFIEPDLLPPELHAEGSEASRSHNSDQVQATCASKVDEKSSDDLVTLGFSETDKTKEQISESTPSPLPCMSGFVPGLTNPAMQSVDQITQEVLELHGAGENSAQYSLKSNFVSVGKEEKKASRFEAAVAEAELDMLLDSFIDTRFLDSTDLTEKSTNTSYLEQTPLFKPVPAQPSRKGPDLFKPASITASFDNDLDNLLMETPPGLALQQPETSTSYIGVAPSVQFFPAEPSRGLELPKAATVDANFDDALDDLLNATSNLMNKNWTPKPQEVIVSPHNIRSSHSYGPISKSKSQDDSDSWFDMI